MVPALAVFAIVEFGDPSLVTRLIQTLSGSVALLVAVVSVTVAVLTYLAGGPPFNRTSIRSSFLNLRVPHPSHLEGCGFLLSLYL